ncbi:TPA: S8 family serine peptidase [Vibrio parahaemolyticus]|nr:S8 family serine peptidase [Vibrio parahaemolyticus]
MNKITLSLLISAAVFKGYAHANIAEPILFKGVDPLAMSDSTGYHQSQLNTYWADQDLLKGANSISKARDTAKTNNVTRVGVIDGGFLNTPELPFVDGYSFIGTEGYTANFDTPISDRGEHCDIGHGNMVASLIGANPQGDGVKGVADVELVAARALKCSEAKVEDLTAAIKWLSGQEVPGVPLISEPVDVINMSLTLRNTMCGGDVQDAIRVAQDKGITFVAAQGNRGVNYETGLPKDCPGVIGVGSNQLDGYKSGFSNFDVNVDIVAYGDRLSLPTIVDSNNDGALDYTKTAGTSLSTPLVTGTIALMLNENPDLTPTEIITILKQSTGKPVVGEAGSGFLNYSCDNGYCGYGVLNAYEAMLQMRKLSEEGVALKSPLAGECDVEFYLDTLGGSIDVCSMGEFKLNDHVTSDNTKIEVYKVSSLDSLDVAGAELVTDTTNGKLMLPNVGNELFAYRMCEKNFVDEYHCFSDELTPLTVSNLEKPHQCNL